MELLQARNSAKRQLYSSGFTLVELLVVMSLLVIAYSMITLSLSAIIPRSSVTATSEVLVSHLRQQQLRAMRGEVTGQGPVAFGVYIQPDQYTLFSGDSITADPSSWQVVALEQGLQLQTSTPSGMVLFERISGELRTESDAVTVQVSETAGSERSVISLNKLGVVTEVQ